MLDCKHKSAGKFDFSVQDFKENSFDNLFNVGVQVGKTIIDMESANRVRKQTDAIRN